MESLMKPPPRSYNAFVARHPKLGEAWQLIREAEAAGPIEAADRRLVKLAVAVGALRQGAVSSAARKARAEGISLEAMEQVVALATSTIGLPAAVACRDWIHSALEGPST